MESYPEFFIWFLQIFDRQKILAGKRIHSTKRLPPSTISYSFYILSAQCRVESESIRKPEFFGELRKAEPPQHVVEMPESLESSQSSPPENDTGHPIATPTKSTPLIPVTEIKDGTQKSKPSVIEGDDNKQRRSPASLRNSWDSSHYRHRRHRRHCHLPIKKVQKPQPETGDKEICFRIQNFKIYVSLEIHRRQQFPSETTEANRGTYCWR
ncbi:hypothetical protein L6452_30894 [Arctium lappa]|uniref:Uncharacterized protein n=1 Tax=Arctium lappa TaxID=4217 RepID=A0ACB8ZJS3_ARCLA|nr:hypothetical protein L6452_30894 [Arctium lappa]